MNIPANVNIVEVGPRDGLQNEKSIIPTEIKLAFIHALADAGLTTIEATSFVSPKWVPQMADHSEILAQLTPTGNIHYPVLVPNMQGLTAAMAAGVKDIAVFTAASETFSQRNTHCSITDSLERIGAVCEHAKRHQIRIRGYVSCVMGCPYEGEINPDKVIDVATTLQQMGCYEISLGDTIGVGTPLQAQNLIKQISQHIPITQLAVHFHDTYGQALANIFACLELGIQTIDSAAGGLGGCPYAPGASGNVATEDVLYMLNGMGIKTGVDFTKLLAASDIIHQHLNRPSRARAYQNAAN